MCAIQDWEGVAFKLSSAGDEELREVDERKTTVLQHALQSPEAPLELCSNIFKALPAVARWRSVDGKMVLHHLLGRAEAHFSAKPEAAAKALSFVKLVEAEFKEVRVNGVGDERSESA